MSVKTLGRGSLAWLLWRVLAVLRVLVIALGAVCALLGAIAFLKLTGLLDLPAVRIADPWPFVARDFLVFCGGLAAAYLVIGRLERIFATLSDGDPFVPQNADHLRAIALIIAAFEAVRMAIDMAAGVTAAMTQPADSDALVTVSLNLSLWFAVLVILVLAEVFREGARLRDEQKLTI